MQLRLEPRHAKLVDFHLDGDLLETIQRRCKLKLEVLPISQSQAIH